MHKRSEILFEKLYTANLFIIGEPKSTYSQEIIKSIKDYLEKGVNILIIKGGKV